MTSDEMAKKMERSCENEALAESTVAAEEAMKARGLKASLTSTRHVNHLPCLLYSNDYCFL